ncbi:MAG: hypothetical protein RIC55_36035 [Pirellulaceae bacterium]
MSLLLGQRKPAESVSPTTGVGSPSSTAPASTAHVAGVPLLLRLPDLRRPSPTKAGHDDKREGGPPAEPTEVKHGPEHNKTAASERASAAAPRDEQSDNDRERTKADGAANTTATAKPRSSGWRNSLWHLLIPIGLLVLFLAAWAVMSSPGEDEPGDAAGAGVETPDIETGELISPQELAFPEYEPEVGPDVVPDEFGGDQLSEAAPSLPEAAPTGDPLDSGVPASPPDSGATSNVSGAPPLLENKQNDVVPAGEQVPGQPPIASSNPATDTPSSPSTPTYSYPTTDPATFGSGSPPAEVAPRIGRQPASNPYNYPSTGAPSLNASSGAAPGVQR